MQEWPNPAEIQGVDLAQLEKEAYGPHGNPDHYLSSVDLERGFSELNPAPRDRGRLEAIVRRHADGSRETLQTTMLSIDEGLTGDGWNRRPPRKPDAQLAVMQMDIAQLIAGKQSITLFGDQLFVTLDLSANNLPAGSRIQVGQAIVEVTPEPHDGCLKFKDRFGQDALVFVSAPKSRSQNRRGVYWKVVEGGSIHVGDAIEIMSRAEISG